MRACCKLHRHVHLWVLIVTLTFVKLRLRVVRIQLEEWEETSGLIVDFLIWHYIWKEILKRKKLLSLWGIIAWCNYNFLMFSLLNKNLKHFPECLRNKPFFFDAKIMVVALKISPLDTRLCTIKQKNKENQQTTDVFKCI